MVGGGHNALVSAAYLAHAGLSVLVLERLGHTGGPMSVTVSVGSTTNVPRRGADIRRREVPADDHLAVPPHRRP